MCKELVRAPPGGHQNVPVSSAGALCPDSTVTHGALVCRPADDGRQRCDLICHHGYQNSLPVSSFLCETDSRQWEGDSKPLPGACQSKTLIGLTPASPNYPSD